MGQILIRRRQSAQALSTLADDAQVVLDSVYAVLVHKAFLFEYEAFGTISTALIADYMSERGIAIVLASTGLANADLATILNGVQITDTSQSRDVPIRQQVFAIAKIDLTEVLSATDGTLQFHLHFKPKSKGGIPFLEGSGWRMVIINLTGSALTNGNNVANITIKERFAYEGGGGA